MRTAFLLVLLSPGFVLAADKPKFPVPETTSAEEPLAKTWSAAKAGAYLDGVGVNWTRDRKCVTCHTNMPYLMARPLLKGDTGWAEVKKFLDDDVASWSKGGKPRGDAYVVATAAALVFTDAHTTKKLSDPTKQALTKMWAVQAKSGGWSWLKCEWPPLEHDDYYGAVLAAVALAVAPDKYAESTEAKAGLEKLRAYFAKTPAPDLHHKAHLLWASMTIPGLMTAQEQKATIAEMKQLQRTDGGWCLPSLGQYKRRDASKTRNDPAADSDGYATGLMVYVLRQTGAGMDDPAVKKGVTWLKANQRESGRWYTRSLNNDKDHYITNAGTAFAVLALTACGE